MLRSLWRLLKLMVLLALLVAGYLFWYPLTSSPTEVDIPPNTSLLAIGALMQHNGMATYPWVYAALLLLREGRHSAQAGLYQFPAGVTAWQSATMIVNGRSKTESLTIIEGWTWRQLREALDAQPSLQHDSLGLTDAALREKLGIEYPSLEGAFFPETYTFHRHTSDITILRQAHRLLQKKLETAWENRLASVPYRTPYEALIMASIVEKETGKPEDRGLVASTFVNRLKIGMPLQSDPTVIYGMGEQFDGNLRKKDLIRSTLYNTYVNAGLPPTPIALAGEAAIAAATMPPSSEYLYFVARGDGTTVFSTTLQNHERAVDAYQRKIRQP